MCATEFSFPSSFQGLLRHFTCIQRRQQIVGNRRCATSPALSPVRQIARPTECGLDKQWTAHSSRSSLALALRTLNRAKLFTQSCDEQHLRPSPSSRLLQYQLKVSPIASSGDIPASHCVPIFHISAMCHFRNGHAMTLGGLPDDANINRRFLTPTGALTKQESSRCQPTTDAAIARPAEARAAPFPQDTRSTGGSKSLCLSRTGAQVHCSRNGMA
jgi:hypothetical protein